MSNRTPSLLACGALLMATAVHAQPAPAAGSTPSTVDPVTVRAAPGPVEAKKEARDFVKSFAAASPAIDQIARWHSPICINVAGLSTDQAARVASRIQEVAEGVGMHALPPGCHANIQVVFTDQPQAFMDKVADTREEVLGYYHRHERAALKTVTRPVQAWYVTATDSGAVDTAGLEFASINTESSAASTGGGLGNTASSMSIQTHADVVDDPDNRGPTGCADAPAFTHCLQSELNNVLIVVDTTRVKGTLGPLTDYLSMLALAQMKSLDGCSTLPSVIDRLGQSCGGRPTPDGLTPADAAYLTSLYASDLEANKPLEEDEIAIRMSSILIPSSRGR
jgi:hypothetical protein